MFNEERLEYLLTKIKLLLDEKVNKAQIAVKPAVPGTAGLAVIAAGATPSGSQIALDDPRIKDNAPSTNTTISPTCTASAEMVSSSPFFKTCAVLGLKSIN